MSSDFVKIVFDLEHDPEEPSFPPISAETLNAKAAAGGQGFIFLSPDIKDVVFQELKHRGCYCEYGEFGELKMLAVSIPETCDYEELYSYLMKHEEDEQLSIAELAV